MSVSKWNYKPSKCDGRPCVGDCDKCNYEEQSADVVEVVRCKDCEFYDDKRKAGLKQYGYCEVYKGYKKAEGYCDIGERREAE